MERYSEYKDSGVKWLGEIPSHWKLLKSKYLWKETFENSTSGKEDLLSVSQYTGVTKSKADSRSESLVGYKIVHKDDLVINIMLAWLGGLGVSNNEGVVSPAYCTYKLIRDYNPKFLHYLYKTPMYLAEFARHSTGVVPSRWRMYTDDFGQVVSLLPPVEEQDAIVRYLDAATSKIDKAIAMQQKMIDLLNERKQIIIQKAVTKGLDENVEMKDSGVEWTEFFPNSWSIKKVKYIFEFISTKEVTSNRTFNIALENIVAHSGNYIDTNSEYESAGISFQENDILFGKLRPYLAKVYLCECKGIALGDIFVLRPKSGFDSRFLRYLLISDRFIKYVDSSTYGAKMPRTNWGFMGNICIAYPNLDEQKKIANYLDKQMQRFDSAISNCQRQITLLQERKQIIINEVVTGKVKVLL